MTLLLVAKQLLLYAHLIAFALAMAEIVKGDWKLLRDRGLDLKALEATARIVTWGLVGLWATGLGLTYLDTGFDLAVIAAKPKLVAKLAVVFALTANGGLLHVVAFPHLARPGRHLRRSARIAASLGAVSTVSWCYAGFLGVGRIIAPAMSLDLFLGLYASALCIGIALALGLVAPRLENRLMRNALGQLLPHLAQAPATVEALASSEVLSPPETPARSARQAAL